MIYNNSKDPVFVKKINLNIWRLKDEIRSVVGQRLKLVKDSSKLNLNDLEKEYHPKGDLIHEGKLSQTEKLDTSEDEMAKAIQEVEATEGTNPSDTTESDISVNAKDVNLDTEDSKPTVSIIQRKPHLPKESLFVGRTILSEISMNHMYLFCNQEFLQGESIVIDFLIPRRFVLNAEVIFCRSYNMRSRIIGANKLPFRLGIKFTFLKTGERTLLRQFINSIEPEIKEQIVNVTPKKEADGDEFGELDDLDL